MRYLPLLAISSCVLLSVAPRNTTTVLRASFISESRVQEVSRAMTPPQSPIEHVASTAQSNPIAMGDDPCGINVRVALDARNGALRDVQIAPGETFSFNATMGNPGEIPYQWCAGVPGGNWCNLAARYAQVTRALGLEPLFEDHREGDLGGGPENSVAIWNIGGEAGSEGGRQDLEVVNTTPHMLHYMVEESGGSVTILGTLN